MVKKLSLTAATCACLFSLGSHAFFPMERPATPMLEVASSAATAPVERLRTIPKDAKKGVMWPPRGRYVRINDDLMRLAPGATIRDMSNRIVLPNTVQQPMKIRYTLDMYGQVRKVWISPTGEYTGRQYRTPKPTGEKRDGTDDGSTDDGTDDGSDDGTDDSSDDTGDDSTDDSTDTPDA